jgi:hypothetical protein
MDGWMDGWMDRWMDGWIVERSDFRIITNLGAQSS